MIMIKDIKKRILFLNNSFEKSSNSPLREYLYIYMVKIMKAKFVILRKITSFDFRNTLYIFNNQSRSDPELVIPKNIYSLLNLVPLSW